MATSTKVPMLGRSGEVDREESIFHSPSVEREAEGSADRWNTVQVRLKQPTGSSTAGDHMVRYLA